MSGRTHLRSAVHCDLVVTQTRLACYGPRGFAISGPATWNSLPPDLRDMCIPVSAMSGRTHLHSAVHCDLVITRTRLACYGPRGFAVSGPATWNSLSPDLRDMSLSAASFFNQLKTELFIRAYYTRA